MCIGSTRICLGSAARPRNVYWRTTWASSTTAVKIDVIMAVYPGGLQVLLSEVRHEFPETPIVFCEVDRLYAESLEHSPFRPFVTGVVLGENAAEVLDIAFRMRPHTKRVALISGTAFNDAYIELIYRRGLQAYARQLELVDLTKLPMDGLLARAACLPPENHCFLFKCFEGWLREVRCSS